MDNTTLIALGAAALMTGGLLATVVVVNFLIGGTEFLFGRPKLKILKSQKTNGFAFAFEWNPDKEPAKFDTVRIHLFNPFGSPSQVDVSADFNPQGTSFAEDLDLGPGMSKLWAAQGFDKGRLVVEVAASKNGVAHQYEMRAARFKEMVQKANVTAEDYNKTHKKTSSKPLYQTAQRSFIAEPLPASGKSLKMATNPEFAGEFSAAGAGGDSVGGAVQTNFAVAKVWIEPGCIVCNACEDIYPEVFDVQAETCVVRPDYPKENGLKVAEAAEACPVEVIKFDKA